MLTREKATLGVKSEVLNVRGGEKSNKEEDREAKIEAIGGDVHADENQACVVDDGGVDWRMKALKRAKEQAAREGRKLDDVAGQRFGSLGYSVASQRPVPSNAITNRRRGEEEEDVLRAPKTDPSLSWGKRHQDSNRLVSDAAAAAHLNKYTNDGNFLKHMLSKQQSVSIKKDAKNQENSDMHLANTIMHNKRYNTNSAADDEYEYDHVEAPSRKRRSSTNIPQRPIKRFSTQQERCLFCFENPNRPKHLVVSIANFTYLMLPQHQPLVPGHCCIAPLHHEAATRSVDDHVWEEIRNFKKCLITMYAKQGKDALFLETVTGLSRKRPHCLIHCIPIPHELAKQAPLYFKKAIDEAESEWSQHNAKKLIDTSLKGLRNSVPENFPYFHVEFGLDKGFAHVIDDEQQFDTNLGLNVVRGILGLPQEDMYRRARQQSMESQNKSVSSFAHQWECFDWTKQLE